MTDKTDKIHVAVFDFDGTLTNQDSLPLFLRYCKGTGKFLWALVKSLPTLLATTVGLASRQEAKEALVTALFQGESKSELEKQGTAFAQGPLHSIIRHEVFQKFVEHHSKGDLCLLISANLDVYIIPWGNLAGFDAVLCSRLAVDSEGQITGKLQGPNCWGPEKVRRLQEFLNRPRESYILHVYGDSRGDLALLSFADYSIKIK